MFYPKSPFLSNRLVESHLLKANTSTLEGLLPWLCQTPKITTYRVNLLQTTLHSFRLKLEAELAQKYPTAPPAVFTIPQLPEVICIDYVKCSVYAAEPNINLKEVIVDSCCGSALLRGAHVYAPGVLSMETGTRQNEMVQIYADLEGHCKKGTNVRYESAHKVFIGLGEVRMQRYQLYGADLMPAGVAIEMKSTISGVPSIGDMSNTAALLQNLPSIVCVRVLNPQPGERVLDMCAAPGNKTTHIAELMRDDGILIALDKSESKIKYVREKQVHNGLKSLRTFAFDATKACDEHAAKAAPVEPPFNVATFDRILLDAPCSALGNRPLLAAKGLTPKMLASYPLVQRKLFEAAVPLLRPGGVLVYSTCTITESENECIVAWALQKFPQLELADASPKFGVAGLPGCGLSERQRCLVQRFGSSHLEDTHNFDTVGFFIAKFRKQF